MSEQFHSIIGLPGSGKTTFLAALWHLLDAGEVSTRLVLDKLVGDHSYLNAITEAWRRCEEVPRTSMATETQATIYVHVPATGSKVVLRFPDLSGESFKQQFATRTCAEDYVEGYRNPGGILLFTNANRPSDGMTLADIGPAIEGDTHATDAGQVETNAEWSAEFVPEQVRLVDLLQFLQLPPFVRRPRRVAVVVSAWDAVLAPRPTPEQWVARELPLLHQFLRNNPGSFSVRVYGVSAQGGDVTGAQRLALAKKTPSRRIQCVGTDVDEHDLTAPLMWLSEGE